MGLEAVELVMAFEEEFEIEISDTEAEKMLTIADSVDCIFSKLKRTSLNERNFHEYREFVRVSIGQALVETSKAPRDTQLAEIFPVKNRRRKWKKVQDFLDETVQVRHPSGMGSMVPDLERHSALVLFIWLISTVSAIWFGFLNESITFAGLFLFISAWLLFFISKPFKIRFPKFCQTVGDLENRLISKTNALRRIQKAGTSRESVKTEVIRIIGDHLGVRPDECTESTRYIEDLKIG